MYAWRESIGTAERRKRVEKKEREVMMVVVFYSGLVSELDVFFREE